MSIFRAPTTPAEVDESELSDPCEVDRTRAKSVESYHSDGVVPKKQENSPPGISLVDRTLQNGRRG